MEKTSEHCVHFRTDEECIFRSRPLLTGFGESECFDGFVSTPAYEFVTWTYAAVTRFVRMSPNTQIYLCCICFLGSTRSRSVMKFEESALMKIVLQTHLREKLPCRQASLARESLAREGQFWKGELRFDRHYANTGMEDFIAHRNPLFPPSNEARNVFVQHCSTV